MASISLRINIGFSLQIGLILLLAALTYSDLRLLARLIPEGVAVSEFVEELMELRRLEKNYFLYQDQEALREGQKMLASALQLLDANADLFQGLCYQQDCEDLRRRLLDYQGLLLRLLQSSEGIQEEDVRHAGQWLSEEARLFSKRERQNLADALESSGRWLFWSVLVVTLLGGVLGPFMAKSLTRPLRQLEVDLAPIAAGRFRRLPAPSADREFQSLALAFNTMLEALEERRLQVLHSQKLASLGILVSGVAHELNNPLSNISTACQLALEEPQESLSAAVRDWLGQIDEQTNRAQHILLALTDYARQRPLTLEAIDVNELLDTTILLVRKELGRQVSLERQVPDGMAILADRQRLQQIFINLLKNAVDAGGPGVTIALAGHPLALGLKQLPRGQYRLGELPRPETGGPDYALISLTDNGPGIVPEVLPHIFDPFFTTRDVGQGTGLGLYIVQEIVSELGGAIAVDTEPGRGTRFELALPCARQSGQFANTWATKEPLNNPVVPVS
jgi:signal transduction histidine kinase